QARGDEFVLEPGHHSRQLRVLAKVCDRDGLRLCQSRTRDERGGQGECCGKRKKRSPDHAEVLPVWPALSPSEREQTKLSHSNLARQEELYMILVFAFDGPLCV